MKDFLSRIVRDKNALLLLFVGVSSLIAVIAAANFLSFGRDGFPERLSPTVKEESVPDASFLKIGFVSDWEYAYHARMKHKLTGQAPTELANVVKYFNEVFRPDVVVGGGDYIESSTVKPEKAKQQLRDIDGIFKRIDAPKLYALGDHDLRALSKDEVRDILDIAESHTVYDVGEWRLVVIDANYAADDTDRAAKAYVNGHFSPGEKQWLQGALKTDRPVIVFGHHNPISIPNGRATGFIQNLDNPGELRSVLEAAGNVVAFVSGHNPMSYYEERNGIHYFIVDTLVHSDALGSFATIEARYAKEKRYAEIRFRQHGENKVQYVVDRTLGERQEKNILPETLSVQNMDEAIPEPEEE